MTIRQKIIDYAKLLGFDIVGFSPAKIEGKYLKVFKEWLKNGNAADMEYMHKIEQRHDMGRILKGAKSVIVLGINYYREQARLKRGHGRIARYAYGRDYHKVIGKKLKKIENFIHADDNTLLTKSYVDTGPIMERALAEQAGLGRIGKNGCLITEKFGSWIFLAEIITTLDLNFTGPFTNKNSRWSQTPLGRWSATSEKPFNICGNCTRCITACPTGAIIAPGIIDSRLCISYLTIENRKKIPPKLAKIIKKTKHLFGCDICQEVCPHNSARQHSAQLDDLLTPIACDSLSIKKLLAKKSPLSSDADFLKTFAGSPIIRAKRDGLRRNAKAIWNN